MAAFHATNRLLVDAVAAEDANAVRARVANAFPARQSPLFHNSNFMKQNTTTGRKVRDGLSTSAKTLEDPVLMKAAIAQMQHDVLTLEREAEKLARSCGMLSSKLLHDQSSYIAVASQSPSRSNNATAATASPQRQQHQHHPHQQMAFHALPIEDLNTALQLCSFVPDDAPGNAVRLTALSGLLARSLDAWAEMQVRWLRTFAEIALGRPLPPERELLPRHVLYGGAQDGGAGFGTFGVASTASPPPPTTNKQRAQIEDESTRIRSILHLSRMLCCAAATPLVRSVLRSVNGLGDEESAAMLDDDLVAEKEGERKLVVRNTMDALVAAKKNGNVAAAASTTTTTATTTVGSPSRAVQALRRMVPPHVAPQLLQLHLRDLAEEAAAQRRTQHVDTQTDDALLDPLLDARIRERRNNRRSSSTDEDDDVILYDDPAQRQLRQAANVSTLLSRKSHQQHQQQQQQSKLKQASATSQPSTTQSSSSTVAPPPRAAFTVNVATRVALDEAHLRIAELERKLLFYRNLEGLVAEADTIGTTAARLCMKNDVLADLGLDIASLVKNYNNNNSATNNNNSGSNSPPNNAAGLGTEESSTDLLTAVASDPDLLLSSAGSPRSASNDVVNQSQQPRGSTPSGGGGRGASQQQQRGGAASGTAGGGGGVDRLSQSVSGGGGASPGKKGAGSSGDKSGANAIPQVPLAHFEAQVEENRRLRTLLAVQQATLNVLVHELDVSDAFRDWVQWRKCMLSRGGGDAAIGKVLDSLRVPVCTSADLEEELRASNPSVVSNNNNKTPAEGRSGSATAQQSGSDSEDGETAAGESPADAAKVEGSDEKPAAASIVPLDQTLSASQNTVALPETPTSVSNNNKQPQFQQQGKHIHQKQHHHQQRHEVFGPTDIAYRRAVRENMSLHQTLEKLAYRLSLLESRK